ncbi:two-component sensor histidine kinase [Amylibacter kogurei]|uniref:histidine kinase n=1 Tax=Paramylibacter kogurei TaxID=1889778 RepID=A0A2G5KAY6_9RHOB|nr:ActS/PrrB/RegB family redox-sensitive histidine kinase [Amylibacter kogurei]PIB26688.1 two-component sensor histidine kinase [Amylibacter kogurei]
MPVKQPDLFNRSARSEWVRLRTLIILRWLAITGQTLAMIVAVFLLDLSLNVGLCALAIGSSVLLNLISLFVLPANKRLSERETLLTLVFDLCQLVILLYLTGGINNPFALLILAPVTISATALSLRATIAIGTLAVLSITTITIAYVPLMTNSGEFVTLPDLFHWGNWTALVIGIVFLAAYARRVTMETFSMSQALAATQMALDREYKLSMLGGVVAAAAHEMGTPLATIKLVSSELQSELSDSPDMLEDMQLIHSQADRLSTILKDMGRTGKDDLHLKSAPVTSILREAAEPHEGRGKEIIYLSNGTIEQGNLFGVPLVQRHPEVIHGLRNLVQNAVDFAQSKVWVHTIWTENSIRILVGDDGKGYSAELIHRIGDPFLGSRSRKKQNAQKRPEYEGMGLGLFIAKTLLERSGAELTFSNARNETNNTPETPPNLALMKDAVGAIVTVRWARANIETQSKVLGENQRFEI